MNKIHLDTSVSDTSVSGTSASGTDANTPEFPVAPLPPNTLPPLLTGDPHAAFTDNQWYCHQARQTVFFSAFTTRTPDLERVKEIAAELATLAPQLTTGYLGARPGAPLADDILSQICTTELVDELSIYPEAWDVRGDDIFDRADLPLFRVRAVVSNNGPDAQGRSAAIMVISTHALLEGADSSLLSRSRSVPRGNVTALPDKTPWLHRLRYGATAAALAPLQIIAASFLAPATMDMGFKALAFERDRIRRAAAKMDVSRRTLMFALVAYGLNDMGRGFSRKSISTMYADLDASSDGQTNDSFFQFRMVEAKLRVHDDFSAFIKGVDEVLSRTETQNKNATQSLLNAMFVTHRRIGTALPFLYPDRFFRFSAGYDLTLSLVPPQRLGGDLAGDLLEPVYCGTSHPGINMCVFSPGRTHITFNFSLHRRLLSHVANIERLLDEIDPAGVGGGDEAGPKHGGR